MKVHNLTSRSITKFLGRVSLKYIFNGTVSTHLRSKVSKGIYKRGTQK